MGQYFRIVNLDKKEWIEPPFWKLWEVCANNGIRMLGYLLATDNPDGTSVIKHFEEEEEVKAKYPKFEILCKCPHSYGYGIIKHQYFGRWCGDRIAIVGDYADQATNYKPGVDGPSWEELEKKPGWVNITWQVAEEFNQFIEDDDLKVYLELR